MECTLLQGRFTLSRCISPCPPAPLARARALGLDARAALADNDSYPFFEALDDLFITGPTGTNVMDLHFVMVGRGT